MILAQIGLQSQMRWRWQSKYTRRIIKCAENTNTIGRFEMNLPAQRSPLVRSRKLRTFVREC